METPFKMSQFEIASPLPSGSYFIVVTPDGVVWNNRRLSVADVWSALNNGRWKNAPASSFASGNDGDESRDADGNYYLHTGGVWRKYSGQLF